MIKYNKIIYNLQQWNNNKVALNKVQYLNVVQRKRA